MNVMEKEAKIFDRCTNSSELHKQLSLSRRALGESELYKIPRVGVYRTMKIKKEVFTVADFFRRIFNRAVETFFLSRLFRFIWNAIKTPVQLIKNYEVKWSLLSGVRCGNKT